MSTRLIIYFLTLLFTSPIFGQEAAKIEKEIGKIIYYDTDISFEKTPAYIIGVRIQDSTFIYSYGNTHKTTGSEPKSDQIFEIGGLTKSFAALLTGILANTGIFHPDSTVNQYLPADYQNPNLDITVLDLVQHTSGLPRLPDGFGYKELNPDNPFGHYTKMDLLKFYRDFEKNSGYQKKYNYSHTNFGLLEIVLEYATNSDFESLLRKHILSPLEMSQTGINEFTVENRNNIVQGYTLGGQPTPPWKMQSFLASEGMKSSMDDLLKYLNVCLESNQKTFGKVIYQNQQPMVKTDISKHTFGGNGWHVITNKHYYDVILHAGSTTGYRSFLGFVKETETGVVILANSPTSMNGLGLLILRMLNHQWKRKKRAFRTKN